MDPLIKIVRTFNTISAEEKKPSDLSAGVFVYSKVRIGRNFQLKRSGFSVKATGMTNLNGDNNVMFGMTIPIGRKRSGQSSWCCST